MIVNPPPFPCIANALKGELKHEPDHHKPAPRQLQHHPGFSLYAASEASQTPDGHSR